ncbi:hypothetical protein QVD17_05509 [Tagetes erecta]|uniref:Tyrosinase copper-binding domain-containing protein n=1 Tax=Tagetes erecta TaxID=13708 RepID=A0AAD8LF67_TARER|nr:hypothetical protein QVD17_05509 [Tagetes erecta]
MSSSLLLHPLTSASTFNMINRTIQTRFKVSSCTSAPHHDHHPKRPQNLQLPNVHRRNLLIGLSGVASLASLPTAIADPITTPDITSNCRDLISGVNDPDNAIRTRKCCPPDIGKTVKDFVFPVEKTLRMRWPAHKGTNKQVQDYKRAIQAMRDLPDDHPHSFKSQAKIHCAYCNGGYTQVENSYPDNDIQIHNSWLFFPFHRWYLYFYERILGNLINEPEFALPFWKWDEPAGMPIPKMFLQDIHGILNPLYDVYRNCDHVLDRIVDLDYDGTDKDVSDQKQIACNLSTVYRDLIRNGGDTLSFFGGEYVAGDKPVASGAKSVGSVEAGCHTAVHAWVGAKYEPNKEDMGNFYSSGYDPLFYCHHANVDRMWKLWKDLNPSEHADPIDPDWLNASYVFYDENQDLVRVYNKDSVNLDKLKYNYIEEPEQVFPWRNARPVRRSKSAQVASVEDVQTVEQMSFPVNLDKTVKVRVMRPAVNRSSEAEKVKAKEILLINGIKFDCDKFVKFEVYVNEKLKDGVVATPCDPEYAGGFAQIPHKYGKKESILSAARFGLTEVLEDTNTEDEEYATVTLVPRAGCEDVTIGEMVIKLVP